MRHFIVVVFLVALVGCGKKPRNDDDAPASTTPASPKIETPKGQPKQSDVPPVQMKSEPEFTTAYANIQSDYYENELKADVKYRNKVGIIDIGEIIELGRGEDGSLFLSTHSFGH